MFIDLKQYDKDEILADICIIGGGAAGISLANEFARSKYDVVLLESGELDLNGRIQELYSGGFKYSGLGFTRDSPDALQSDRVRSWGGTTNIWGGMVAPFDSIDFLERSWVPFSGWPFTKEQLMPYYNRASHLIGTPEHRFSSSVDDLEHSALDFGEGEIERKMFFNVNRLRLGEVFHDDFSKSQNVKVYLNATVVNMNLNPGMNFLKSLSVRPNDLSTVIRVKAKKYILAAGAIENARILLYSNDVNPKGVGNNNDLVGRFFQGHGYTPTLNNSILLMLDDNKNLNNYQNHQINSTNAFGLLGLSSALQSKHKLLNHYMSINTDGWSWPVVEDQLGEELKQEYLAVKHEYLGLLDNLGIPIKSKWHAVYSTMLFEQEPNPDSRVTLITERDWLGLRKAYVSATFSDLQVHTMITAYKALGSLLGATFKGKVRLETQVEKLFDSIQPGLAKHHIGTTRMHRSTDYGVVDENCKSHFVDNLYIAGSSVFPTSSATNPTFTIIAMSIRLADHIKQIGV